VIAVDTNILVYAHRAETPAHAKALGRVRDLAEGRVPWGIPVFCLAELVRVATHLRVFTPPSTLAQALGFLDDILASPSARLLVPSLGFPACFRDACEAAGVRGNLAFDAQIAGLCLEHGIDTILTADRDFARFPWLRPVAL